VVEAAFPQNHCKSASRQPPGDSGNAAGTRGGVPTTPLLPSRSLNR
jgi:hypothetical protein